MNVTRLVQLVSTIAVVLVLIAASAAPSNRIPVDTYANPQGIAFLSVLQTTVSGEVEDGQACFWIGTDPEDRGLLVWPEGYYALDSPLRVLDPEGRTVAVDGELAWLGGGFFPFESSCGGGQTRAWYVSPSPGDG